jgi:hypothetical protein
MEEIDLGRLLPLLIIWGVYWLISRRGSKRPEEPPVTGKKKEGGWLPPEALEFPPLEHEVPERVRTEPVYYHLPPLPGSRTPPAAARCKTRLPGIGYTAGVSRRNLRRIFVWSEIIGPPVGLREKGEDRLRS